MVRPERHPHGPGKRLTTDERLRGDLELCDRWGIPHSQFLGTGDGTWSARDRAKALAYREYQRSVCPHCGTRYDDWDHGAAGQDDAYVAVLQRCVGCQVIADKQSEAASSDTDPHGLKIALVPAAAYAAQQALSDLTRTPRTSDED